MGIGGHQGSFRIGSLVILSKYGNSSDARKGSWFWLIGYEVKYVTQDELCSPPIT